MRRPSISGGRSRRSFFAAFRIVAGQFLYYLRNLDELSPEYDDCPSICPYEGNDHNSFCAGCPRREAKEDFTTETVALLNERCEGWERYGFENLHRQVLDALDLSESDDLTQTAATCQKIIKGEKNRIRRIDDWNAKQKKHA